MTRTKATVKRRQQRRRLEREAERARLRAEQQQQTGEEEEDEAIETIAVQDGDGHAALGNEEAARTCNEEEEHEEKDNGRNGKEEEDKAENENVEEAAVEEETGDRQLLLTDYERQMPKKKEKTGDNDGEEGQLLLTDYERQREQRLKENAAKLATLNLTSLACSLRPSTQVQRQSSNKRKKDADYVPSSSSDSEDHENDDISGDHTRPKKQQDSIGDLDDDHQALQQAIAMSLDTTADTKTRGLRKSRKRLVTEKKGSVKKESRGSQQQFGVDEIASIFAIIDEQGKGRFSVAELERVARLHDFTWSKQELADMIDVFDSNKDGQLELSEFQTIFGRTNMLRM